MADPVIDPVVPPKSPLYSKTFWVGLLGAVSGIVGIFAPGALPYLDPNGAVVMAIFGIVTIVLRFVTKGAIEFGA